MGVPRLFYLPRQTPLRVGVVEPGAKVTFLKAETTTQQNVYTTSALDTVHTNPVVADAAGELAAIYLDDNLAYRVQVRDSDDVLLYDQDNINNPNIRAPYYGQTTGELAAGVTPTNYEYEPGDVRRYGADPLGMSDSVTAFVNAIASGDSIYIPDGTYKVNSQIEIAKSMHVSFGNVVIDASAATGTFAHAVLYFNGGSLTALPDLSASPAKGDDTLTFASAPALSENEVFIIYNPTDSSYADMRTVYRAGEFCKVYSISGSTVEVYNSLYAGYTFGDIDLYKLAGRRFSASGGDLHVIAPNTATINAEDAIKVSLASQVRFTNVRGSNSGDKGIGFDRCYDVLGVNLSATQNKDASFGTDYGLAISNSQKIDITGNFWGRRHATTLGGDNNTGSVPCRDISLKGIFENGPDGGNGVNAADTHGNCEFIRLEGIFNGGIKVSGDNVTVKGIVRSGEKGSGIAVYCTEWVGCNHDFSGLMIDTTDDPMDATSRGVIDIGGNQDTIDSGTTRGGLINLRGITFRCPNAERLIQIRNRGGTPTEPIIIDMSDCKVLQSDGAGVAGFLIDAVSGDDFDALYCRDVYSNGMPWSIANVDSIYAGAELVHRSTWNPGAIADGDEGTTEVTVTGAEQGDFVQASLDTDTSNLTVSAKVISANTVRVILDNTTGASIDVASGTLRVKVSRNFDY